MKSVSFSLQCVHPMGTLNPVVLNLNRRLFLIFAYPPKTPPTVFVALNEISETLKSLLDPKSIKFPPVIVIEGALLQIPNESKFWQDPKAPMCTGPWLLGKGIVELEVFETGVPPRFRVHAYDNAMAVKGFDYESKRYITENLYRLPDLSCTNH